MNKYSTRAIIICHGKSEVILCQSIKSNLRMPIEIESKDNGESSIQVTSLIKYLNNKIFKNSKSIINNYPKIEHEKHKIKNCKIFIIMDLDEIELTEEMKNNYKTKVMFKNLDYYDIIVPIYNIKNLDDVCNNIGYDIDINNISANIMVQIATNISLENKDIPTSFRILYFSPFLCKNLAQNKG